MAKLFLTTPRLLALSVAIFSSIGLLSATPAVGLTFKATIYNSPDFEYGFVDNFNDWEFYYTLPDDLFDTVVSSPLDTLFTDRYSYYEPVGTVIPEVVTDFKIVRSDNTGPSSQSFGRSIFGIGGEGSFVTNTQSFNFKGPALFIQILSSDIPAIYSNIFQAIITAPEGLPLSACKTQICEGEAAFSEKGRFSNLQMIHTPVTKAKPVPEPSAAVALGFVSAWLLKRQRKISNAQAVTTADKG